MAVYNRQQQGVWWGLYLSVLIWSVIDPKDYFTWMLEVAPTLAGLVVMVITYKRFPLTPLAYVLILLFSWLLMVGGHYTYAHVPLFDWLRDITGGTRNNFDKLGHFAQGFVPAIIAREIFLRQKVVIGKYWLFFLVVCVCMAVSAVYELVEWWVALLSGGSAEAFLALQGYTWDTQSDMFYALIGAVVGLLLLSRWHDRQIARISQATGR